MKSLQWTEIPTPEPGPEEVRVRVEAVGLNHLDTMGARGVPLHRFPFPLTPGSDCSGAIEKLGPGSAEILKPQNMTVGSAVGINPGVSLWHLCRVFTRDQNLCAGKF